MLTRQIGLLLAALILSVCSPNRLDGQDQPAIRSRVVLVPLDVRVVDRNGDPVTDLTASDFTVYENGVRQEIAHFLLLSLVGGGDRNPSHVPDDHPLAAAATSHRTFLLVLGRGNLNAPTHALDALIDFVRQRLTPTDRVGVVAYLRTSEPTTDHAATIRFLERYRELHQGIEERIATRRFKDPLGPLDSETQSRIRSFFAVGDIPPFNELPGASTMRRSKFASWVYLRWAIFNLRRVTGEKHVILIAEDPLPLFRINENPNGNIFVKLSNEARVALSYIHTGGVSGMTTTGPTRALGPRVSGRLPSIADGNFFAPTDHRVLAQHTGGTASYYSQATEPLDRLERASRFQYVLGYYPTVSASAEIQRTIRVVVNRKDVTPQYRHGYRLASSVDDEKDLNQTVAEYRIATELQRLAEANTYSRFPAAAAPLRLTTKNIAGVNGTDAVQVSLSFNPGYSFVNEGESTQATFHVVVVLDDADDVPVGELRQAIPLTLSAGELAQAKNKWIEFDVKVPVKGKPARVRAALYDAENDRLISNISHLRDQ
jgi:VWFA-related protein